MCLHRLEGTVDDSTYTNSILDTKFHVYSKQTLMPLKICAENMRRKYVLINTIDTDLRSRKSMEKKALNFQLSTALHIDQSKTHQTLEFQFNFNSLLNLHKIKKILL